MTGKLPAVIFDLGGVLLDWNPRHVYRKYFRADEQVDQFLAEIDFADWNRQQDLGRPFAEGVALLSNQFPQYASLIRAYHEHWEESIAGAIGGSVEIARDIKTAGYSLFALSNWSAETFPIARAKYQWLALFQSILISGEVGMAKPDPRIYNLMLQRIGHPATECLLIDDASANIQTAAELGFQTIRFESAPQLARRLRELGLLQASR